MVKVCLGTACHVQGSPRILEQLERDLGIQAGQTTADGKFSVEAVRCVGACALAPLVLVNDHPHGKMSGAKASKLINTLNKSAHRIKVRKRDIIARVDPLPTSKKTKATRYTIQSNVSVPTPPRVVPKRGSKSLINHIVLSNTMIMMIGINMGKVILLKVYHGVAPSTFAASKASLGKLLRPASRTNIENGVHCQIDITAMVY